MNRPQIIEFLKNHVEIFSDFQEEILAELVDRSRLVNFEENEAILEFGDEGRSLGVILKGKAELSVQTDTGDRHTLRKMGPGDIFGVVSLMTGNRAMADVIGKAPSQALLIPQGIFSTIVITNAKAVNHLSKLMLERLRRAPLEGRGEEQARAAIQQSQDPYGLRLKTEQGLKLLVLNAGSSSLKYNFFDTASDISSVSGLVERIGSRGTRHIFKSSQGRQVSELPRGGHEEAVQAMIMALTDPVFGVIRNPAEISAVGHRVVHGGSEYSHPILIDDKVEEAIKRLSEFAPLHNPVNLAGVRAAKRFFPEASHVAVFDTAFHQTIPSYAFLYGLPYDYFDQKGIRRYGFHGTSHKYASLKAAEFLRRPINTLSMVICHLGNGSSVCAVDHGRSIDTSMGFTPAEGLIMGSRCGDIDPAILIHLMRREGMDAEALENLIQKEGGLKGLSGVSNDMREIEQAAEAGDYRAQLTIKTFCYRIRKYIGAYTASMGELDALVFTGGIGQGSVGVRSQACQSLEKMGLKIDEQKNRKADGFHSPSDISADDSLVRVLVIPADEERMIARETLRVLESSYVSGIIESQAPIPVPVEVSAHHVHLSPDHVEALFGPGHELSPYSDLSQPGQFACHEKVNLVGPKGRVDNVRVLGPPRKETQVEISMTEQFKLGVNAPIRESGDLLGTPGMTLEGPVGSVHLEKGVICTLRHIHMTPLDALKMGLQDKDVVRVKVNGGRGLVFGDVVVRVSPSFRLAFHIDTDEANAANITRQTVGYIDGIQSRR